MNQDLSAGRCPNDLSRTELVVLVIQLQQLLYFDEDGRFHPDQEWNADTFTEINGLLHTYELVPDLNSESSSFS